MAFAFDHGNTAYFIHYCELHCHCLQEPDIHDSFSAAGGRRRDRKAPVRDYNTRQKAREARGSSCGKIPDSGEVNSHPEKRRGARRRRVPMLMPVMGMCLGSDLGL